VLTLLLANGRDNFTLHAELNWTVLAVTLGLSIVTGILFGLAPALHATRVDIVPALKELRTGEVRRWRKVSLSHVLVVTQIAFSLILLVAAGLFGRTLAKLHSIDVGFNRENVLLFSLRPSSVGYSGQPLLQFYDNLRQRLLHLPGALKVTMSSSPIPMGGGTGAPITIDGVATPEAPVGGRRPNIAILANVGPDFFMTMEIPILAGREFTDRDVTGSPPVAIVNRTLAKVFGLENPVGRFMSIGKDRYEIVGLAKESLVLQLKETPAAAVFFPAMQSPRAPGGLTFEMRVAGDPMSYATAVRQLVREADSRVAIFEVKSQAAHIDQAISSEITLARLCSVFALLALIIACVGLYGSVAFNVERRTSEIGIRVTLGAQATRILWMVLREVLLMAAIGLAIGLPMVLAATKYVKSFLYEIEPNDPLAIAFAVVLLVISGLFAGLLPARRASRIDPMVAVRHD
jgi:predicted permease